MRVSGAGSDDCNGLYMPTTPMNGRPQWQCTGTQGKIFWGTGATNGWHISDANGVIRYHIPYKRSEPLPLAIGWIPKMGSDGMSGMAPSQTLAFEPVQFMTG